MDPARMVRMARAKAGISQRELAKRARLPQPAIARIEAGRVTPRVDTLERLLHACGATLEVHPRLGEGVDRTLIHQMLRLSPEERIRSAASASRGIARVRQAMKKR